MIPHLNSSSILQISRLFRLVYSHEGATDKRIAKLTYFFFKVK
jgi:hypothetical protein